MTNRLMMWGMPLLALACGGESVSYEGDEQEFETVEQDVTYIPTYGYMSQLGAAQGEPRCLSAFDPNLTNAQLCTLPPNKALTVRVTGTGMSAGQKTAIEALVDGFFGRFSGELNTWTMSRVTSGTADVNIQFASLAGTNKNSIHTYADSSRSGATLLSDSGAEGSWEKYGSITCSIDHTKIVNDFTTPQEPRVESHAVDYCVLKGLGIGSGVGVNRAYSIAVTPDAFKSQDLGNYTKCMANAYDAGGTSISVFCGGEFDPCPCLGQTDN